MSLHIRPSTSRSTSCQEQHRTSVGVVGGRQPSSPPTSVCASHSPTSPPQPLGPLDLLKRQDIMRSFAEFHIRRDATYIAPPSMDIKDIYNKFDEPVLLPELELEAIIFRYCRACLLHQNDSKVAYILTEGEYNHLYDNDEIKLTNVDIAFQAGYRNLYQHIHLHQHPTHAINFKITSCVLLGTNHKTDNHWKKDNLGKNLYIFAILIKVDEPRTRNILHPYRRRAANIRRSSSTTLHRHLHCTSTALDISSSSSKGQQVSTSLTKSTIQPSSAATSSTRH